MHGCPAMEMTCFKEKRNPNHNNCAFLTGTPVRRMLGIDSERATRSALVDLNPNGGKHACAFLLP